MTNRNLFGNFQSWVEDQYGAVAQPASVGEHRSLRLAYSEDFCCQAAG